MRLQDLNRFQNVVIQCHDNPDADSIASGFGVYCYFKDMGRQVRLIYGGRFQIQKSNLLLMIQKLFIPIEHVEEMEPPELLITVDCQYGAGNMKRFEAANVAVIDHHQAEIPPGPLCEIRTNYGSCSTLVWSMMRAEGIDLNKNLDLATALYYGLYTDTGQFSEIYNPVDRDMRDILVFHKALLEEFKNANISREELKIAGNALTTGRYVERHRFFIVRADCCDPNILGLISDFIMQTDQIDCCVVYNELADGYKLSVRSCKKEIRSSDMAVNFTEDVGSGGGGLLKAGGYISKKLFCEKYQNMDLDDYFEERLDTYVNSYKIIYGREYRIDPKKMRKYKKRPIPIGYIRLSKILEEGDHITVRTLAGDFELQVREDDYLMIGIQGEVYHIKKSQFDRCYRKTKEKYQLSIPYIPSIHNHTDGSMWAVTDYARSCVPEETIAIFASVLDEMVKVFTPWDENNYMLGRPGDYLAVRQDDFHDIYIIEKEIFSKTYQEVW